ETVIEALGNIGDPAAVPELVKFLKDKDESICRMAAVALGKIGDASVIPDIKKAMKGRSLQVRMSMVRALVALGDKSEKKVLLDGVKNEDSRVRAYAARILGLTRDPEFVPVLTELLLNDRSPAVREKAAAALGRIGDPSAKAALEKAMGDYDPFVKAAAKNALQAIESSK
ncbi:MAG: HEAT repeat domain-containing protein, partial [Planctomycetota bacterium]